MTATAAHFHSSWDRDDNAAASTAPRQIILPPLFPAASASSAADGELTVLVRVPVLDNEEPSGEAIGETPADYRASQAGSSVGAAVSVPTGIVHASGMGLQPRILLAAVAVVCLLSITVLFVRRGHRPTKPAPTGSVHWVAPANELAGGEAANATAPKVETTAVPTAEPTQTAEADTGSAPLPVGGAVNQPATLDGPQLLGGNGSGGGPPRSADAPPPAPVWTARQSGSERDDATAQPSTSASGTMNGPASMDRPESVPAAPAVRSRPNPYQATRPVRNQSVQLPPSAGQPAARMAARPEATSEVAPSTVHLEAIQPLGAQPGAGGQP